MTMMVNDYEKMKTADIVVEALIDWKVVIEYFVYIGYSISIRLPKVLTICLLCVIYSIFSTKAIAFVVHFSIQYEVDLESKLTSASLLSSSLPLSLSIFVFQTLFYIINKGTLSNPINDSSQLLPAL